MNKLNSYIFVPNAGWRDMQLKQNISIIENPQLYRLKALERHSTFCICDRYIAGQNSVKLSGLKISFKL